MPADKPNLIRHGTIASPTTSSAYHHVVLQHDLPLPDAVVKDGTITLPAGSSIRFDYTFTQLRLFAAQASEAVSKWPLE